MQTQDAPAEIIFKLWPWLEANKSRLIGAGVAMLALWGVLYYLSSQKEQKEVDAGQAYTALMLNTMGSTNGSQIAAQLEQVAEKYSGTLAAKRARLQAAAALFDTGNYPDAQAQFQLFLDTYSGDALAATAELGLAASYEAQNRTDAAIATYQRVISVFPGSSSVPPAELALGRIAEEQNKLTDALNYYQRAVTPGLESSLAQEAKVRAAELQLKISAVPAPKPMVINVATNAAKPAAAAPAKP